MNFNYFVCYICIMRGKGFDGSKFKLLWVFFINLFGCFLLYVSFF